MNSKFVFPRHQPAAPRVAQAAKSSSSSSPNLAGSRDSNALRASILDIALELGIGSNSLVTGWMFNNALEEEPEDEQEPVPSPGLTHGSPTSEESALSPSSSLLHSQYRRDPIVNVNGHGVNFNLNQDVNKLVPLPFQRGDAGAVGLSDQYSSANEAALNVNNRNVQTITVNDGSMASSDIIRPKSPSVRKLRKRFPGKDGYESDGGYMSEKKAKQKENSGDGMDVKQDLKERKKKKSFIQVINKISNDVPKGYDTDGGAVLSSSKSKKGQTKKSKTKDPSKETGYETDGGYQSGNKKSKTRFFKLPTKSSKADFHVATSGSVPALPNSAKNASESVAPLPIAGRFATLSYSISSPTTEGRGDNTFPDFAIHPFPATLDVPSTTSSPSPVLAGPSTFDRLVTAPISGSPSAFNANFTHLHPKNRDSRLSAISSSSSGSGTNQHCKPQKRKGLFSQLHSPPTSMPEHQHQHGLRTASSLSSLQHSRLVITRAISSTSPDLPSSPHSVHSVPSSPNSPISLATSFSSLQSKKPLRVTLEPEFSTQQHSPSQYVSPSESPHVLLPPTVPVLQISSRPSLAKVRPRNPPTDGFGPRSPLTSDCAPGSTPGSILSPIPSRVFTPGTFISSSTGLSPNSATQGNFKRSSQLTIIPSSDYIVPSPQNSPLKMQTPEVLPPVLATYYHQDYIPPQPNRALMAALPTPHSSESESPAGIGSSGSTGQLPSAAHLRQRMSKINMRQSGQQEYGIELSAQRGRELFLPSRPVVSSTMATRSLSVGGSGRETGVGLHQYPDSYPLEKSDIGPSVDDIHGRRSWMDADEDVSLDDRETLEVEDQELEEPDDFYEILDRFEIENGDMSDFSGGQALERSHSFKAGKYAIEQGRYPDSFNAEPYNKVFAAVDDVCGFEDDRKTVGDRTSRWSGSVYSRSSILDEDESEERRDRLVRRVEAMLDAEKVQAQTHIPPLPKIPHPYANAIHKPIGNINENAGTHSNMTPGRSWHKF